MSRTVVELHPGRQEFFGFVGHDARRAYGVFALDFIARVHQTIGKLSARRKKQQPFGVEVQTSDGNPAGA